MKQEDIDQAIAGDDPFFQALVRVGLLQQELGAGDVIGRIMKEPDDHWSMVIKFNAVFEAVLVHVLTDGIGADRLKRHFEDLPHSRRIEFAFDAGLIRVGARRFMKALNRLRNAFAHDVRNLDRTITSYLADLRDDDRASLLDGINAVGDTPAPELQKLATDAPQTMVMVSAVTNLAILHDTRVNRKERREDDQRAANAFYELSIAAARIAETLNLTLPPTKPDEPHDDPPKSAPAD